MLNILSHPKNRVNVYIIKVGFPILSIICFSINPISAFLCCSRDCAKLWKDFFWILCTNNFSIFYLWNCPIIWKLWLQLKIDVSFSAIHLLQCLFDFFLQSSCRQKIKTFPLSSSECHLNQLLQFEDKNRCFSCKEIKMLFSSMENSQKLWKLNDL